MGRLLLLLPAIAALIAGAVFLTHGDTPPPSAEEQATIDALERIELRIDTTVWRQIQNQPWFGHGQTTGDGLRLANLLSEYYYTQRPRDSIELLAGC